MAWQAGAVKKLELTRNAVPTIHSRRTCPTLASAATQAKNLIPGAGTSPCKTARVQKARSAYRSREVRRVSFHNLFSNFRLLVQAVAIQIGKFEKCADDFRTPHKASVLRGLKMRDPPRKSNFPIWVAIHSIFYKKLCKFFIYQSFARLHFTFLAPNCVGGERRLYCLRTIEPIV